MDTFARVPAAGLVRLHMDPEGPTPAVSGLRDPRLDLPDAAVETFLALTGPGSGSTLLSAELRQLGGALARPAEGAGALPMIDGAFVMFGGGDRRDAGDGGAGTGRRRGAGGRDDVATPRTARTSTSPSRGSTYAASFSAQDWTRLKGIRSAVDPGGVVRANHPVPRLYENGLPTPVASPRESFSGPARNPAARPSLSRTDPVARFSLPGPDPVSVQLRGPLRARPPSLPVGP